MSLLRAAPALAALLALFGGALAGAVRQSLDPTLVGGALSAAAWRTVLADPAFLDALAFSARTTLVATALAAAIAVAAALLLCRRGPLARALFALPVPVPPLLVAIAAAAWLAPGGLADRALRGLPLQLVHDRAGLGVVLVYVYKEAPFLVLLLLNVMGRALAERDEAAATLGLGRRQRLAWITWPTIRAPLALGSLVVAAFVFGSFEVPLAVGPSYPPTLATYALAATKIDLAGGQARSAAALLVAAGASIVLALAAVRLARAADA